MARDWSEEIALSFHPGKAEKEHSHFEVKCDCGFSAGVTEARPLIAGKLIIGFGYESQWVVSGAGDWVDQAIREHFRLTGGGRPHGFSCVPVAASVR